LADLSAIVELPKDKKALAFRYGSFAAPAEVTLVRVRMQFLLLEFS
jgi:hypothetical protein